jgi:hypothetical protein
MDSKPKKGVLSSVFGEHILPPKEVINRALDEIVEEKRFDANYIKSHFSELVTAVEKRAYDIFLSSQSDAWGLSIKAYLAGELQENATRAEVTDFLAGRFKELDSFFLSLANSRKIRAGSAFQNTIRELFKKLNYPFDEQREIDGKPDFVLPSIEHFRKNSMDCIIFTVKRTLRERWRQIVTEGTRGLGFFLATIDKSITDTQLAEMSANRIYLVVPENLKRNVASYAAASNVITFEDFFEDFLDPKFKRWTRERIV